MTTLSGSWETGPEGWYVTDFGNGIGMRGVSPTQGDGRGGSARTGNYFIYGNDGDSGTIFYNLGNGIEGYKISFDIYAYGLWNPSNSPYVLTCIIVLTEHNNIIDAILDPNSHMIQKYETFPMENWFNFRFDDVILPYNSSNLLISITDSDYNLVLDDWTIKYSPNTSTYTKHDGIWKPSDKYVKDNGIWKPSSTTKIRHNGVWKEV